MPDRIRFGFIGCGGVQIWHARRMAELAEAEIVAAADPDAESRRRFVERTGLQPRMFADHREMLSEADVDAVLVGTPHSLHLPHAVDALRSGKHVLCEKPMVNTTQEAEELIREVEQSGKVFMISYQRHAEPKFLWMKQQVASGHLGELTYISALLTQGWKWGTAGTWRQDPALSGGGQIHDSGSHIVDVLLWLAGPVAEVHAFMDARGTPVDINTTAALRFRSGCLGSLAIVGDAYCWQEDWTVSGEKGTVFYRNGQLLVSRTLHQAPVPVPDEELPTSRGIEQAFLDAVLGRAPVLVPARVGLEVLRVTEAAWRSAREGRPVRVEEA